MKKYLVSLILRQKVLKLKKISRVNKKNCIYFCETESSLFSIKIYKNKYNSKLRFNNELLWLKKFNKNQAFQTPKLYMTRKILGINILVLYWVDGISMKQLIDDNDKLYLNKLNNCINNMEKIWGYPKKINIDIDDSLKFKCNMDVNEIINKLKKRRRKIMYCYDCFFKIYNLLEKNNGKFQKKVLINSDISLHEFLFQNNELTLLDYEYFCYGDINNDLAGFFYSASNSIIDDKKRIEKLYNLISSNKHFYLNNFLLYLIQRIILADYFAGELISDNEIVKYYNLINNLYGNKSLK